MSSPASGNLCPIKKEVSGLQLWSRVWLFQKYFLSILFCLLVGLLVVLGFWVVWGFFLAQGTIFSKVKKETVASP